jgi:hypothetical protein
LAPQDFDANAADEYGRLAAFLAKRGTFVGAFDTIAPHAIARR